MASSLVDLIERVYDDFADNQLNASYFRKRAIISPTNVDTDEVNECVAAMSKEKQEEYLSEDTAIEGEEMDIQTSVFNGMRSPGLPPHKLKLKVGAVVMVVWNISPPKICNGTRVMVTNLRKHLIVGKILGGVCDGEQISQYRRTFY
ncbi:hypothetical protein Pmani_005235 [Petrolisthes manimaculis]|uniref:DNA helicase Pif1-like 2B domain-containing protein n=1 Tax=Petrolisthes manimaculis TaxID=1843537 RepID=A0AAE1UME1_9EUCA|nr:hypothetical protein Pmani_005235 [Petrolisthes manimaculis]